MKKIIVLLVFLNMSVLTSYCSPHLAFTITVVNSGGTITSNQSFNIKDLLHNWNATSVVGGGPGSYGGGPNQIHGFVEDGLGGGNGWMTLFSSSCTEIKPAGYAPGDPVFRIKFNCYGYGCVGQLNIQYDQYTKQFSILPSSTMLASYYSSPCSTCGPKEINSVNAGTLTYTQTLTESDDWIKVSNLTSTPSYQSTVVSSPNRKIKFDVKPPGFIELNPDFIATPSGSGFFLAQIVDGCGPLQPPGTIAIDQYACDSYTWPMNNITYTASGVYSYTNMSSGDEYELNLTLGTSTSSAVNVVSCDSYTWPSNALTYTTSGTYHDYSINSTNCLKDDILNLTINQSTTSTTSATACDTYTWNGTTYTASGVYTFTSLNVNGCSQGDLLNLTIAAPIVITSTVTNVSCVGANNGSISYSTSGGSGNLTTLIIQGGVSSLSVSASCTNFCATVCTTGICWSGINNCWCFQPGGYPAALLSTPTNLTAGTYAVVVVDNVTGCSEFVNLVVSQPTISCNNTLSLVANIEGYWNGSNAMVPVLMNQGQPNASTQCDSITVELHNATAPYAVAYSTVSIINTNGTAGVNLSISNGSYYIVIKHRNGLETWSANPVVFNGSPVTYNFTTSASQAYGSNQVEVSPGIWAFYSGDINGDENIDLADFAQLENDIANFIFGYANTDINGDGNVDILDTPVVEDNINNFIFSVHP